jgi:hypothetical protein
MRPDYAAIGYYNQWTEALSNPESEWILESQTAEQTSFKRIAGRVLILRHRDNPSKLIHLLTIRSDLTIWGDLASFIAEGLLSTGVRGILFMGSAGAIASKAPVYGISVPSKFNLGEAWLPVENFVELGAKANQEILNQTPVLYRINHGHTFSPTEQDIDFIKSLRDRGIQTVDVEQNLIAQVIDNYNKNASSKVSFGAINIITDRPAQILDLEESTNDLDEVDFRKKNEARLSAVTLALRGLALKEKVGMCRHLFR